METTMNAKRLPTLGGKSFEEIRQTGNKPAYHFAGTGKPITGGNRVAQLTDDYQLSRFACYLAGLTQEYVTVLPAPTFAESRDQA